MMDGRIWGNGAKPMIATVFFLRKHLHYSLMLLSRFLFGLALGFVATALLISVQDDTSVSRSLKGTVTTTSTFCDGLLGYWSMDTQAIHPTNEITCAPSTLYSSLGGMQWKTSHAPYPAVGNIGSIHIDGYSGIDSGVNNPNVFTWSAWVKFPTETVPGNHAYSMIFSTVPPTSAGGGIRLYISPYNKLTMMNEEGYTNIGTNRALIPYDWTHIALTRSGDNLSNGYGIYVNGIRTLTGPTNSTRYNGRIWIGSSPIGLSSYPPHALLGDIDDVRLYNRALTATEIAGLANGQGYDVSCSTTCIAPSSSSVSSSVSSSLPPPPPSSSSSSSHPSLCCNVDTAQCQILSSSPNSGLCCNLNTGVCQ